MNRTSRWAFVALCVLGVHCSNRSPTPDPNAFGNSGSSTSGGGTSGGTSGTATGGSGAVGGSGSSSAGSGGSSGGSAASGSRGADAGGCVLGTQGLDYAGCTACATCEQTYCCNETNACLNDTTCNGFLACQTNCFNGQTPDGGMFDLDAAVPDPEGGTILLSDLCAQNCLPTDPGPVWNVMQTCISPQCDMPCLCP